MKLNGGRPVSNMYSLITNHAPCGGGSEYLEYIVDEGDAEQVRMDIIESYEHQSEIYLEARKLKLPMLRTFMTK